MLETGDLVACAPGIRGPMLAVVAEHAGGR
jgi:hypothetical protein